MIEPVKFGPSNIQNVLNQDMSIQEPPVSSSRADFLDGVRKMQAAEGLSNPEALQIGLQYYKESGRTIEGIDIDMELEKYTRKVEEIKEEEADVGFFESLGDVLKKRGDRGAEILIAGVKKEGGQGLVESGVQYGANFLGAIAELAGTAVIEGLDEVTPQVIQDKVMEGVGAAFETKGGQWVADKIQQVEENMTYLRENDPRAARNFQAFYDAVDGVMTFYGGKTAIQAAKAGAKTGVKTGVETGIKAGAKAGVKAAKAVGEVAIEAPKVAAKRTFREVYKLNQETIEQAFKNPELFTKAQKIGADDFIRETADNVVSAINKRADELTELGKGYASIRKGEIISSFDEIDDIAKKSIDLVEAKQLTKADSRAINEAKNYIQGYKGLAGEVSDLTDIDLLSLRKQLDSVLYDPNTGLKRTLSSQGNRVVNSLRRDVDKLAKERIKGLKELDAKFAPEIQELNKLKKVIYDARGDLKDTYIKDISNLLGKGKELKIERVRKLVPDIDEKLAMYRALKDLDLATNGFKVGTYNNAIGTAVSSGIGAILVGPAGAVIMPVLYQMIANPKFGIEIVKKLSMAAKMQKSIIQSMTKGVALKSEQITALVNGIRNEIDEKALKPIIKSSKGLGEDVKRAAGDMVDDIADKTGTRAKFIDDTGRSIDDFSKARTAESAKLQEFTDKQIFEAGYVRNIDEVPELRRKFDSIHPDFQKDIIKGIKKGGSNKIETASEIVKNSDVQILSKSKTVYRGQTKGQKGFLIEKPEGQISTSGGNTYGISTATKRGIAEDFAMGKGNGEVIEITLKPGAKILRWKESDGFLDNISIKETKKLRDMGYDAIEDFKNFNGEYELRILNTDIIK